MTKLLSGIALVLFLLSPALAQSPMVRPTMPKVTRNDIQLAVSRYAFVYGVDEKTIHAIIRCESTHNPNAYNISSREYSVGLVQINLKAHPKITESQARDIDFSIRFLAEKLSQNKGSMWSCYSI